MKSELFTIAAAAACFALGTPAAAQSATPEMFGALPNVSEVAISPSGRYLAMIQNSGSEGGVIFRDLENPSAAPTGVGLGDSKARQIVWADDEHVLLRASQTHNLSTDKGLKKREMWRWLSISRVEKKAAMFFGNEPGFYNPDSGSLLGIAGNEAIFARMTRYAQVVARGGSGPSRLKRNDNEEIGWGYSVFSADLDGGGENQIARGEEKTVDWALDRSGQPVARVDYLKSKKQRQIYTRPDGTGHLKLLSSFEEPKGGGASITLYGSAPTANKLVATSYVGDKRALVEFDLATGAIGAPVFTRSDFDLTGVDYDYRSATATGVFFTDDLPRAFHLDAERQKTQDGLVKTLAGATPMIVSSSADESKMIVKAIYSDHPDHYFFYDKAAKKLDRIATSYTALDGKVFAKKERFDHQSTDGLLIPGYLTVPKGASRAKMPLIVLPHGGPWERDDMAFDYQSFFYAARGYLVYQPNFRGSDGYGLAFRDAGNGEWGRKMQDDITDGVRKLIADGIADPERICIVGGSYGGYAAPAGATLTPDLYACAVSVNGISNLPQLIGATARDSESAEDYWDVRIGSRFSDSKSLNAVSPVKIASRAGAPILLIHGKDDTVVPIAHSIQMRDALRAAGKPVEFVELKGEDHWLSTAATRIEMLKASIAFIDKHVGAQ